MFRRVGSNQRLASCSAGSREHDLDAGLRAVVDRRGRAVRVLVTGAPGFVAPHLIAALVRAATRSWRAPATPTRIPAGEGVEPLPLDLAAPLDGAALPAVDAIVHLAQANVPFPAARSSSTASTRVCTLGLLDAARRTRRAPLRARLLGHGLRARRAAVPRGRPGRARTSSTPRRRSTPRSSSRATPTSSTAPSRCASSRPTGPGQVNRLVPGIIGRVRERRAVTLNAGGRPRMNPIYVDDAVAAILRGARDRRAPDRQRRRGGGA